MSIGQSSRALRGDYDHIRADYTVDQPYGAYSAAAHDRWRRLYRRQMELMPFYAAPEFLASVRSLDVSAGIPDFGRVNRRWPRQRAFRWSPCQG